MEFLNSTCVFHTNPRNTKKLKTITQKGRYIQCMYCWAIRETIQKPQKRLAECTCFNPSCTRKGRHTLWHDPRNVFRAKNQCVLKTCQHCLKSRILTKFKKKHQCLNLECINYKKFHPKWKLNISNQISILS
jgi:hypothetical protein